ncbi:type IV secretory system conjugative DNA transfer family protein [Castellaniella sp.]|uniref:type IV secretory system conjugative DNA transfer family protein n=1 Tax=Castellaniella sp. TaxID=1955812 RepID=UPI002AFE4D2A|nr:type IV secretory system conjugative DNA transfer family protein [Castellaniella sp.]
MSLEQASQLYEKPAYVQAAGSSSSSAAAAQLMAQQNDAQRARSQALLDTALGVGVKAGIAWQLDKIRKEIKVRERALDTIYDFGGIMIQNRVVPPVIIEATDLYNQDGDYALRLSGAYYKIETQARFSSVPPSWRAYLSFPEGSRPASGYDMIKPDSSAEKDLWKLGVADGWQQGVHQANVMLEHSMDLLNRDFTGMLRFHRFVLQGKITMPVIASESIPVSHDGATMTVDETLLRITTLSEFDGDIKKWTGATPTSALKHQGAAPWITSSAVSAPQIPSSNAAQNFPVAVPVVGTTAEQGRGGDGSDQ